MFSRRVVAHGLAEFSATVFARMIEELRCSRFAGDQILGHNMELNVDVRGYHASGQATCA